MLRASAPTSSQGITHFQQKSEKPQCGFEHTNLCFWAILKNASRIGAHRFPYNSIHLIAFSLFSVFFKIKVIIILVMLRPLSFCLYIYFYKYLYLLILIIQSSPSRCLITFILALSLSFSFSASIHPSSVHPSSIHPCIMHVSIQHPERERASILLSSTFGLYIYCLINILVHLL